MFATQVLGLVQQNLSLLHLIGPLQKPNRASQSASKKRDYTDTYLSPGTEPIELEAVTQKGVTQTGVTAAGAQSLGQKLAPLQEAAGRRTHGLQKH